MIPESGTREELRNAWLAAIEVPLPGETYETIIINDINRSPEVWHVREVRWHSHPPMILLDVYIECHDVSLYDLSIKGSLVSCADWRKYFGMNAFRYAGTNLPRTLNPPRWRR